MVDHKDDGSLDQLYAWREPLTFVLTEYAHLYEPIPGSPEMERLDCAVNLRPDRRPVHSARLQGIGDTLHLSDVACVYCQSTGTLLRRWPDDVIDCPRCRQNTLQRVSSYIT
jgi:hypothetical protein